MLYGHGISKSSELVDLGVEAGIIQKSGSWFSYDGNRLAQGRDAARKAFESDPALAEEVEKKIKDKYINEAAEGGENSDIDDIDDDELDIRLLDMDGDVDGEDDI